MCSRPVSRVVSGLAVRIEKFEIAFDGVCYGQRSVLAGSMMGAGNHALARLGLGLPIIENRHAVGVGVIVGNGEDLKLIGLVADVMTRQPFARPGLRPAVAQMQSGFEGAVVRLAARLEPPPGRSGLPAGGSPGSGPGGGLPGSN